MYRFNNTASAPPNLVTAQCSLLLVVLVLLLLFIVHRTVESLRYGNIPSSAVIVESPGIALDPCTVPAIDGKENSHAVGGGENVASQSLAAIRDIPKCNPCYSKTYKVEGHGQVMKCIDFYELFELWHPGCEKTIADWECYMAIWHDHTDATYRHHYWEIPLTPVEEEGLNPLLVPIQSLKVTRRGDFAVPRLPKKPPPYQSHPKQNSVAMISRLHSFGDFIGHHGPVAIESTGGNVLENASKSLITSTLKVTVNTNRVKRKVESERIGHLDGSPPLSRIHSTYQETSPISGDAACSKCIVYPEDCKNPIALSNCISERAGPSHKAIDFGKEKTWDPDLESIGTIGHENKIAPGEGQSPYYNARSGEHNFCRVHVEERGIDKKSAKLGLTFAPTSHATIPAKPTPIPKQPLPQNQRPRVLGVEEPFAPTEKQTLDSGDMKEESTSRDPIFAPFPHVPIKPKPNPRPNTLPPKSQRIRMLDVGGHFEEAYRPKTSDSEHSHRLEPMMHRGGSWKSPPHPEEHKGHKGRVDNARKVHEEAVAHSWFSLGKEINKRGSEASAHPLFNGVTTGPPGAQRSSLNIHSSSLSALGVQKIAKNCYDRPGSSLDVCSKHVWTKNTQTLFIALLMGILGFLFCLLVILDKVRRAKSRRASVPMLKGKSPDSSERMSERVITKNIPPSMDGANDGWTSWIMEQRESARVLSPSLQVNAPRIPSLTLPKPTLATVRKLSGLDPDLENLNDERSSMKGRWKSRAKLKWKTTP